MHPWHEENGEAGMTFLPQADTAASIILSAGKVATET